MAYLWQDKKSGNFFASQYLPAEHRTKRVNLHTTDPETAKARLPNPHPKRALCFQWEPKLLAQLQGSRTTRERHVLFVRARSILATEPERFAWLLSPKPRYGHLCALGRFVDPEIVKLAADKLCARRPTYKAADIFCRRARGGLRNPPPLYRAIEQAITSHREKFPDCPEDPAAVLEALALDYRSKTKL